MLIADEVPVDEARRDELLEDFQAHYHGGDGRDVSEARSRTPTTISTRTKAADE